MMNRGLIGAIRGSRVWWAPSVLAIGGLMGWATSADAGEPSPQAEKAGTPLENPIEATIQTGDRTIRLMMVAEGMTAPTWGTVAPGCREGLLYVTDQDGILWQVDLEAGEKTVFLDVRERLVDLNEAYDERGLLGVAFHPQFCENGRLYTYESHPVKGRADFSTMPEGKKPNHQSVVAAWRVPEPKNPQSKVDPNSAKALLRIDQPQMNHNGGTLVFGPDGLLYISLGDGGAADDQGVGHVEGGNGQEPGNVFGTILRIDPDSTNAANGRYGIPPDNPFVDDPNKLDAIYAYGFRNPWRISFDRKTGELYAGDVGQRAVEEIDLVRAGGNYGWRRKEGTFNFHPRGENEPGFVTAGQANASGLIAPIAQYDHDDGSSVIGGFVYRGSDVPELDGLYIFGDYNGRLFYLEPGDNAGTRRAIREFRFRGDGLDGRLVLGFGQDARGAVYVLANQTGGPNGKTGVVLKVAPPRD